MGGLISAHWPGLAYPGETRMPIKTFMKFTLRMFRDDMGSFTQPGCNSLEDALWHVNKAREHDNLAPIDLDELKRLSRGTNLGWLKMDEE